MNKHITPGTVVYKFFVDKMGGNDSTKFVGDEGQIFYDPTKGDLRLSDDTTPGGIPLLELLMATPTSNTAASNTVGSNTVVYNYSMFETQGVINFGNVKSGFQTTDHFGWVLLDGRLVSQLSATQQAIAAQLGWAGSIPDATGRVAKMTGAAPGSTGGLNNNTYVMTQSQLPKVTLTGTTDTEVHRAEDHAGATAGFDGVWLRTGDPSANSTRDLHNHNVNVSLNPGSQIATNVENAYMSLNTFVYLGL